MEINRKMNLVVPVDTDKGRIYIHSTPISKEVYRENFLVLGKVFAQVFGEGLGVISGPRVAYMMLEKIAKDAGAWDGDRGVKNSIISEVIKNSKAIIPIEGKGWDDMPLDVAIDRGHVDPDDVLSELIFFTCVFAINKPAQAIQVMGDVNTLWGSAITSQSSTDWMKSLPTSTPKGSTGKTEITSSVAS